VPSSPKIHNNSFHIITKSGNPDYLKTFWNSKEFKSLVNKLIL